MIHITRDGNDVKFGIECRIPNYDTRVFILRWSALNPIYAGLLSDHLTKTMHANLDRIRHEEYERGWRDAKSKNTKSPDAHAGFGWA